MGTSASFLARWALRKAAASHVAPVEQTSASGGEAPSVPPERSPANPLDGVDPETLTADFDFSRAMDKAVPPEVRTLVLRRLWSTCAEQFAPDALDVYRADYNAGPSALAAPVLASAADTAAAIAAPLAAIAPALRRSGPLDGNAHGTVGGDVALCFPAGADKSSSS